MVPALDQCHKQRYQNSNHDLDPNDLAPSLLVIFSLPPSPGLQSGALTNQVQGFESSDGLYPFFFLILESMSNWWSSHDPKIPNVHPMGRQVHRGIG